MNTLQSMLHQFIDEYATELSLARKEDNFKRPFGALIRQSIPVFLKNQVDNDTYIVKGSVGAGRWTDVPWIAVFDKRISQSAQKGVYIVYLLNKDSKTLFLTLNQGATSVAQNGDSGEKKLTFTGIASSSGTKTTVALGERAKLLKEQLRVPTGATKASIESGSKAYDAGCVFSKSYTLETLPDDQTLIDDLHAFVEVYAEYYNNIFIKQEHSVSEYTNVWWPSEDEYSPDITKDQWVKLLNNPEIIGPIWGSALAMFYTEKEGTTCADLGIKFGKAPTSISGNCTQLAKRIHKETGCPVLERDGKKAYWPILFFGKEAEKNAQGVYAWKLRPELYDALTEFGITRFLPAKTVTGSFDSWEILNADTAVKTCDKSFFEYNGSGVPKDICWFFNADHLEQGESIDVIFQYEGKEYTGRVANESSDRRRVRVFWNSDLGKQFDQKRTLEQTKATFKRTGENTYIITISNGGNEVISVKDTIASIKAYISAKGFSYEDGLIENFYLSLKSKPFVILAGTSGTGKTRLVRLFAEAVGANSSNGRYEMVSVRPDWSDSTDLFGHVDLNGNFIPGAIIDFVKRAESDSTHPYFLCLDEMNLARVEYYLSDFLSVIETRDFQSGHIVSEPLISDTYYGSDQVAADKYGSVSFPENLYVIGTVNMDETTFPFSRKVLDRANTIEFSFVDLMPPAEWESDSPVAMDIQNDFLKTEYLLLAQCADRQEDVNAYCAELQQINRILQQANAHVGYRVRDEIVFYLLNNKAADLLPENEAIDNEIMQKILPRIQGSSASIKNMLCELFKVCAGDYEGQNTESDLSSKMMKVAQKPDCKYPKSAQKIAFMIRRFEEDGFTSYWL